MSDIFIISCVLLAVAVMLLYALITYMVAQKTGPSYLIANIPKTA